MSESSLQDLLNELGSEPTARDEVLAQVGMEHEPALERMEKQASAKQIDLYKSVDVPTIVSIINESTQVGDPGAEMQTTSKVASPADAGLYESTLTKTAAAEAAEYGRLVGEHQANAFFDQLEKLAAAEEIEEAPVALNEITEAEFHKLAEDYTNDVLVFAGVVEPEKIAGIEDRYSVIDLNLGDDVMEALGAYVPMKLASAGWSQDQIDQMGAGLGEFYDALEAQAMHAQQ
jgi:hypothetical protein